MFITLRVKPLLFSLIRFLFIRLTYLEVRPHQQGNSLF
jgi:hypothetical protein